MEQFNWFILTLGLFCLGFMFRFAFGIKYSTCQTSEYNSTIESGFEKVTDFGKDQFNDDDCYRREVSNGMNNVIRMIVLGIALTKISEPSMRLFSLLIIFFTTLAIVGAEPNIVDVLTTYADPKVNQGEYEEKGAFHMCQDGWFITHFRVWDLPYQKGLWGSGDDKGILEIEFKCQNFAENKTENEWIRVKGELENPANLWGPSISLEPQEVEDFESPEIGCEKGMATGLDMKAQLEVDASLTDEAGMVGFALYCASDEGDVPRRYTGQVGWGTWMRKDTKQICPKHSGLCGFRAQMHNFGSTGLNNVEMPCCSTIQAKCKFTDQWEDIFVYNNQKGKENVHEKFKKTVGTGRSKQLTVGGLEEKETKWNVAAKAKLGKEVANGTKLEAEVSGGYGESTKTKFHWESVSSNTWDKEVTQESAITIPAGAKTVLRQVVGKCGATVIRTEQFQKIDTYADGRKTVENIPNNGANGLEFQLLLVAVSISFIIT